MLFPEGLNAVQASQVQQGADVCVLLVFGGSAAFQQDDIYGGEIYELELCSYVTSTQNDGTITVFQRTADSAFNEAMRVCMNKTHTQEHTVSRDEEMKKFLKP